MPLSRRSRVPPAQLVALFFFFFFGAGCAREPTVCTANEGVLCFDCLGPTVKCSFEGVEVITPSCQGCQAQVDLYDALCDAGSAATVEEVEQGRVCEEVDTDTDT